MPAEPHTGTVHEHNLPAPMRPGNPPIVRCPAIRPEVVLRVLYG